MAKSDHKRVSSKHKIDRRLGVNLWGRPKSPLNMRDYAPGQHGQRRKKPTDTIYLFGERVSSSIGRTLIACVAVSSFFYVTPIFINFALINHQIL